MMSCNDIFKIKLCKMHGWNLAPVLETIYLKKKKKTKMWIQGEFHKEKRSSRQFESHTLFLPVYRKFSGDPHEGYIGISNTYGNCWLNILYPCHMLLLQKVSSVLWFLADSPPNQIKLIWKLISFLFPPSVFYQTIPDLTTFCRHTHTHTPWVFPVHDLVHAQTPHCLCCH